MTVINNAYASTFHWRIHKSHACISLKFGIRKFCISLFCYYCLLWTGIWYIGEESVSMLACVNHVGRFQVHFFNVFHFQKIGNEN